jgi:F0F1-type ATP synthase assembly protein I
MTGILIGSSIKGMLVGVLSGWYARKVQSTSKGILVGSVLGLFFAAIIAGLQGDHYLEILLPGFVVGAIIGFLTQRMGTPVAVARK